jgi:hypothetical protein
MKVRRRLGPMLTVLTTENTLSDSIKAKYRVMSPVSLVPIVLQKYFDRPSA